MRATSTPAGNRPPPLLRMSSTYLQAAVHEQSSPTYRLCDAVQINIPGYWGCTTVADFLLPAWWDVVFARLGQTLGPGPRPICA